MVLLKEDGSLDVERINKLPYEEYMEVMGTLTEAQVNEYLSALPINEAKEPVRAVKANFILNEATQSTRYVPIEEGIRMAIEIAEGIMEGR